MLFANSSPIVGNPLKTRDKLLIEERITGTTYSRRKGEEPGLDDCVISPPGPRADKRTTSNQPHQFHLQCSPNPQRTDGRSPLHDRIVPKFVDGVYDPAAACDACKEERELEDWV